MKESGCALLKPGGWVDLENVASQKVAARVHSRREEGFEKYGRPIYLYSTEREGFE